MAEDYVDIASAAKLVVPEKQAVPYWGEPEAIADQFTWGKEKVIGMQKTEQQLTDFSKENPDLKFDVQKTLLSLARSTKEASDDYDKIYANQKDRPNYHDGEHTTITATIGLKIFLGGMSELYKDPDFKAAMEEDPDKLQKLIDVAIESMARHELDDWWSRRSEDSVANNPNDPEWDKAQEEVKSATKERLAALGVSPEDFNRLNILDTFFIPVEADPQTPDKKGSLDLAMGQDSLKEPYFKDTDGKPDFSWISKNPDVQRKYLRLLAVATRSADFLQLYNPNYYRAAVLNDKERGLDDENSNVGSVTLAVEFHKFRPGAAKPIGWIDDQGDIAWKKVGVGKAYLEKFALPNIRPGVDYLKAYNKQEGTNVDIITTHLEKTVGIVK